MSIPMQAGEHSIFRGLTAEELKHIEVIAEERVYEMDALLIEEGTSGDSFFVIVSGDVDIVMYQAFAGGGKQILTTISGGDILGELSLLDGHVRSASALAATQVRVLELNKDKVLTLLAEETMIGYKIMSNLAAILSKRIRETNRKLKNTLSDLLYY